MLTRASSRWSSHLCLPHQRRQQPSRLPKSIVPGEAGGHPILGGDITSNPGQIRLLTAGGSKSPYEIQDAEASSFGIQSATGNASREMDARADQPAGHERPPDTTPTHQHRPQMPLTFVYKLLPYNIIFSPWINPLYFPNQFALDFLNRGGGGDVTSPLP